MPVVLSQHFSPLDRPYEDAEFVLYHYPKVYFSRVRPYDRFIYYRPLGQSQRRADSKHYFGHGVLGPWFDDPRRPDHRFVPIVQGDKFPALVPLMDARQRYHETESDRPPMSQAAVRDISETAYYRILAAGDVSSATVSLLPSTEDLDRVAMPIAALAFPTDRLRRIEEIPPGAGYVPSGETTVNVFESAALQERARADHQFVLQTIQRAVIGRGGTTWYNNNIDLFARLGERRFLIEAKSLTDVRRVVDRVRYGIGQLADYAYRYADELSAPTKTLAIGTRPPRETAWLGSVLDQERTAFLCVHDGVIEPLNERANDVPFLG